VDFEVLAISGVDFVLSHPLFLVDQRIVWSGNCWFDFKGV
jgi:hypothetical protein